MFQRPDSTETAEDLVKQDGDLRNQTDQERIEKLKRTQDDYGGQPSNQSSTPRKRSKFSKRKDIYVDYTNFSVVEANTLLKSAVIGEIVARDIITSDSSSSLLNAGDSPNKPINSSNELHTSERMHKPEDINLKLLGEESSILDGVSGLGDQKEASKLHKANVNLISAWTHEQRLQERDQLLSSIKPELVTFLRDLRKNKASANKSTPEGTHEEVPMEVDPITVDHEAKVLDSYLPQSELPIPPSVTGKWLNMQKVETAKLEWMTELPSPKALKRNEEFSARFNFEGDLLAYETNIDVHEGLHHHGQEPERAGYTIHEVLILVRSRVSQQRHIGLKILANILRNAKEGLYDSCFDYPIIQLLVDIGVVFLLRFSIDESTVLVYQEALRALYHLLCSESDEKCLQLLEPWSPHYIQPGISSKTNTKEKDRKELDDEETEMKDTEIIQLDLIRAVIRMDVLLRMRYFLETIRPSPLDVIHILGILTRIARHSLSAAWAIADTPRLLHIITTNFIPSSPGDTRDKNIGSVYGVPLKHALTFLKVLAQRGRQLATLISNLPGLMDSILAYISVEPNRTAIPTEEALHLSIESYSLLSVLLSYGLSKPQEAFKSFYPLLIKQLVFYRDRIDVNIDQEKNRYNYDVGVQIINLMTKALLVGSQKRLLEHRLHTNQPSVKDVNGKPQVVPPPILAWQDFTDIFPLIESCLQKWMFQLATAQTVPFSVLRLVGSVCKFIEVFIENWVDQKDFEGVTALNKIQHIHDRFIIGFIKSNCFKRLLSGLEKYSVFCSSTPSGITRDPNNLASVGSLTKGGRLVPVMQLNSPFCLLLPLSSLMVTLTTLNPSLDKSAHQIMVVNDSIRDYIKALNESEMSLASNWFARIELHTFVNFAKISSGIGVHNIESHCACMRLLQYVQKRDEHLMKTLVKDIICTEGAVSDLVDVEVQIQTLGIKHFDALPSPAIGQPIQSTNLLTKSVHENISRIGTELYNGLVDEVTYKTSWVLKRSVPFLINSFTVENDENLFDFKGYWPLLPLQKMFPIGSAVVEQSDPIVFKRVTCYLQMTYLILKYRRSCVKTTTNTTGWIRHMSQVFLAANDLFLDVHISSYLQGCVREVLRDGGYAKLDPKLSFPGLPYCFDWYKQLVAQYQAVSYGDTTFGLFVLLPLQMYWPEPYRGLVWSENCAMLSFMNISYQQVNDFIPVAQFVNPLESNEHLIRAYKNVLCQSILHPKRNSLLYCVAQHHVTNFSQTNDAQPKTN